MMCEMKQARRALPPNLAPSMLAGWLPWLTAADEMEGHTHTQSENSLFPTSAPLHDPSISLYPRRIFLPTVSPSQCSSAQYIASVIIIR